MADLDAQRRRQGARDRTTHGRPHPPAGEHRRVHDQVRARQGGRDHAQHGQRARPPDAGHDGFAALAGRSAEAARRAELVNAVVNRMTDGTIATSWRATRSPKTRRSIASRRPSTPLFPTPDHRERLIDLAHDEAASSPLGNPEAFEEAWDAVAQKLLTSYSDKPFVSEQYARELSGARTAAIEIEETTDDPPERIRAWLQLGGGQRAAKARSEAGPGPAADRAEHDLLDHDGQARRRAARGSAARGRLRRRRPARRVAARRDAPPRRTPIGGGSPSAEIDALARGPDDACTSARTSPRSTTRSSTGSRRCACRSAMCSSGRWPKRSPPRSAARPRERLSKILIGVRRRRAAGSGAAEGLAERRRAADRHLPAARVRRQRGPARADRAPERQRAAGPARGRAGHGQHRHRRRVPGAQGGAHERHRASRATRSMQSLALVRDERRRAAVRVPPAAR